MATTVPQHAAGSNHELHDAFERQKKIRKIIVPTDDKRVKLRLRELKQPICLFGEGPADRADRLRQAIFDATRITQDEDGKDKESTTASSDGQDEEQDFWRPGTLDLLVFRRAVANFSLRRAAKRLERERELFRDKSPRKAKLLDLYQRVKEFSCVASQIGDERPVAVSRLFGRHVATCGWGRDIRIWALQDCSLQYTLKGHTDRVSGVCWSPSGEQIASAGSDSKILYWPKIDADQSPVTFSGHEGRVGRVAIHGSGNFIGSAGFDSTFRLWDIASAKELYYQTGHSREVYTCEFHPDGSLAATAGLDAIGRVWDLRNGRSVMILQGHVSSITSLHFHPHGRLIATGSADHSIRIWDLRHLKTHYKIPAHSALISDVRFIQGDDYLVGGSLLCSASFDGTVKVWSDGDYKPLVVLQGHENKVFSCDIADDGSCIVSAGYDRTFKLWSG